MVNKFYCLLLILLIAICPQVYPQVAKIVELKGKVLVKSAKSRSWRNAKIDTYLNRKDEIKTKENSMCSLAFDEALKNILTIQENSHIRIDNLRPGEVFMPRGRVFSLIEDLAALGEFQVRTPVAVAGVRGTGDSVETNGRLTKVKCFEGNVYVHTLNKRGRVVHKKDLRQGQGLEAAKGGKIKNVFNLSDTDTYEWLRFKDNFMNLKRRLGLDKGASQPSLDIYSGKKKYYIDPMSMGGGNVYESIGNSYYDPQIGRKAMEYVPPKKEHKKVDTDSTHDNTIEEAEMPLIDDGKEAVVQDVYDQRSSDINILRKDESYK